MGGVLLCQSPNRNRIDDGLHGAGDPGVTEHEHELPRPIGNQGSGVHVLQDVDPVARQQDLVDFEDPNALLERHHLEAPLIGTDGHDFL